MVKNAAAIVCAVLMVSVAFIASAEARVCGDGQGTTAIIAPVTAPVWKVGDSWAMGIKENIGDYAQPYIREMKNLTTQNGSTIKSVDATVDGTYEFYEIYKITEVTDSTYTMSMESAQGTHVTGSISMTGDLPKEGTWTQVSYWDPVNYTHSGPLPEEIPTEVMTVSASGGLNYELKTAGDIIFDKSTISVKKIDIRTTTSDSAWMKAKNCPDLMASMNYGYDSVTLPNGTEMTTQTQTVKYVDYDISVDAAGGVSYHIQYTPQLDLFNFPINVGENWPVESNMSLSGVYWGNITQTGLPKNIIDMLADNGTTFPIDITKSKYNTGNYINGRIKPDSSPISFRLECTGTKDVMLEDGSVTTCCIIDEYVPPTPPYGYLDVITQTGGWTSPAYNTYANYSTTVESISQDYPLSDYKAVLTDVTNNYSVLASLDPLSGSSAHWTSPEGIQGTLALKDNDSNGKLSYGDTIEITNILQTGDTYDLWVYHKPTDYEIMFQDFTTLSEPGIQKMTGMMTNSQHSSWFAPMASSTSATCQYYSKDKGFIVSGEIAIPDMYGSGNSPPQTVTIKPMSEGTARKGIDGMTPSSGFLSGSTLTYIIITISVLIAVIIIGYVAYFAISRKKKTPPQTSITEPIGPAPTTPVQTYPASPYPEQPSSAQPYPAQPTQQSEQGHYSRPPQY